MHTEITNDNVDRLCGSPGARYHLVCGEQRWLNFEVPDIKYGNVACMSQAEDVMDLIPRSQWDDIIAEKDAAGSWLINNIPGVTCKDQDGLGFCHAYGTVSALECALVYSGDRFVELAPESVGGYVTGWRNSGGDPMLDLAVIRDKGACEQSYLDARNSLSRGRWRDGWEENALTHCVKEFWDLRIPGKVFDAVMSCTFRNQVMGLGQAWWSHFYHGGFGARKVNGVYQYLCRNSWTENWPTRGAGGFFWLSEGRARGQGTPDWAFAVRTGTKKAV
jgi:hypothetical protein